MRTRVAFWLTAWSAFHARPSSWLTVAWTAPEFHRLSLFEPFPSSGPLILICWSLSYHGLRIVDTRMCRTAYASASGPGSINP